MPANNQEFRQWPAERKAAALALLTDHPKLTSLNLVGCEITDACCSALAEVLLTSSE